MLGTSPLHQLKGRAVSSWQIKVPQTIFYSGQVTKITKPSHWYSGTQIQNTSLFWHEERTRWMHFWNKETCFKERQKYLTITSRDNIATTVHTVQTGVPTLRGINDSNRLMSLHRWNLDNWSGSGSNQNGALMVSSAMFSLHFPVFHLINITLF